MLRNDPSILRPTVGPGEQPLALAASAINRLWKAGHTAPSGALVGGV